MATNPTNQLGYLKPNLLGQVDSENFDLYSNSPLQMEAAPAASVPDSTQGSASSTPYSPFLRTATSTPPSDYVSPLKDYSSKIAKLASFANSSKRNNTSTPNAPLANNLSTEYKNLGTMTSTYGSSTKFEKFHPGIDIANKYDTPIPTFTEGTVTSVETGKKHGDKAFGNTITITDPWGNKHKYSHLHQVYVKVGDKVKKGNEVATMGDSGQTYSSSGKSTGTHLDYRITDAYNKSINPLTLSNNS